MRRHDDLAMAGAVHPVQQLEELDLARWRQRGFRLVEDEDALPPAAFLEEAQEAFTVRVGQEVRRQVSNVQRCFIEIARHREEARRGRTSHW